MLSIVDQPIAWAVTKPITKTPMNLHPAVMMAPLPTLSSFLKLNSRPRPNIINIIPISAHWCTASVLEIPK